MAMNTLLAGLVEDVYKLTKRPDLEGQTVLAVKAATLKAHHSDYFYKDLYETGIKFDAAKYIQQFEYLSLLPRFRTAKYVRKVVVDSFAPSGFVGAGFLNFLTSPDAVLDIYKNNLTDVAYMAGDSMQIRSSTEESLFLLGCYLHPNITDDGYSSFIAREYPFAIIYDAAATVFKGIGFDEQAALFRADTQLWYNELKINCITPVGM